MGEGSHAHDEGVNNRVAIQRYPVLQRLGTTAAAHDRVSRWGARGEGISAQHLCRGACRQRTALLFVVYIDCLVAWDGHTMSRTAKGRDARAADKVDGHLGVCRERSLVSFFGERNRYGVEDQHTCAVLGGIPIIAAPSNDRQATVKVLLTRSVYFQHTVLNTLCHVVHGMLQ